MNKPTSPQAAYPVEDRNRIRRRHDRAAYDHASVHAVLDAGMLAHVSYVIDGQPYCTPTIHWREGTRLYWHGSSASRMLRAQAKGVPVCVSVAMLDGLVMARTGMNHSANYRSAMCFGTAALVEGVDEKTHALLAMLERYFPGRNETLRGFSAQDIKATKVVGMEIETAVAKARADINHDEPEDLENPTWAGVIEVRQVIGERTPCPHNTARAIPSGLEAYAPGRRLDEAMGELVRLYAAEPA